MTEPRRWAAGGSVGNTVWRREVVSYRAFDLCSARSGILRRMPTGRDPVGARQHGAREIELQGNHGRSTTWREADNLRPIRRPGKMLRPPLAARIKERNGLLRYRIKGFRLVVLEVVAIAAREPEIVFLVGTAGSARNNVFNLQQGVDVALRGQTVAAPIAGLHADSLSNLLRYVWPSHGGHPVQRRPKQRLRPWGDMALFRELVAASNRAARLPAALAP